MGPRVISWAFAILASIAFHAVGAAAFLGWYVAQKEADTRSKVAEIKLSSLVVLPETPAIVPLANEAASSVQPNQALRSATATAAPQSLRPSNSLAPTPLDNAPAPKSQTFSKPEAIAGSTQAGVSSAKNITQNLPPTLSKPVINKTAKTALTPKADIVKPKSVQTERTVVPELATRAEVKKQTQTKSRADQLVNSTAETEKLSPNANSATEQAPTLPDPSLSAQDGVAAVADNSESSNEALETYESVLAYLQDYSGPVCFTALPSLTDTGAFQLEVFAPGQTALNSFRNSIVEELGTLPDTELKRVSDAQCRALAFVRSVGNYPAFQLYFDVPNRQIESGSQLLGRLRNTGAGFLSLLLIDDEGLVQNLSSFLRFRPGFAEFDIPMTVTGNPVETQQLLIGISSPARPQTVTGMSGERADKFFFSLAEELAERGQSPDVAVVAFSVR